MYRREFFRKMIQPIALLPAMPLYAGSGSSKLTTTDSIPGGNIDLNSMDEDTVMTAEVTIREIEHYYFPNGSRYMHNGEWVSRDHSQVNALCTAGSIGDDFELELYFDAHGKDWVNQVLHDLTEGSRWMVAGHYSIIEGKVSLLGPRYRKTNLHDWNNVPVS